LDTIEKAILKELTAKHRGSRVWDPLLCLIALIPVICLASLISVTVVNVLILDEWDHIFSFSPSRRAYAHPFRPLSATQRNPAGAAKPDHAEPGGAYPLGHALGHGGDFSVCVRDFGKCLSAEPANDEQAAGADSMAVANVLIFSTEQSQNWSWGIQMIVFMPIMFITTGILIAYSRMHVTWKFVMCMVLSTAATFSYANGQLAWVLLLAALVIGSRMQTRRLGWRIWMWAAAFAANMWVYYRDYQAPPDNPSMLLVLKHPVQAMEYFAAFLGASLDMGS